MSVGLACSVQTQHVPVPKAVGSPDYHCTHSTHNTIPTVCSHTPTLAKGGCRMFLNDIHTHKHQWGLYKILIIGNTAIDIILHY